MKTIAFFLLSALLTSCIPAPAQISPMIGKYIGTYTPRLTLQHYDSDSLIWKRLVGKEPVNVDSLFVRMNRMRIEVQKLKDQADIAEGERILHLLRQYICLQQNKRYRKYRKCMCELILSEVK